MSTLRALWLMRVLLTALWRRLGAWAFDVLSPPTCAACDAGLAQRTVFCAACAATLVRASGDEVLAFGDYGGALADAVRRLKYENRPDLARPLGELVRERIARAPHLKVDIVVPVPLHGRRLQERGYNQAALLARGVARDLEAPLVTSVLVRTRDTKTQASLTREERSDNMVGAFRVQDRGRVKGRRVLLVDDVVTTGRTTEACRQALMEAGARSVTVAAVARTA